MNRVIAILELGEHDKLKKQEPAAATSRKDAA